MTESKGLEWLVVECAKCGVQVARGLRAWTAADGFSTDDGEPAVVKGFIARAGTLLDAGYDMSKLNRDSYVVERSDLVNTQELDGCGCCDPDGAKILCPDGHQIGVFDGDCWKPHLVELDASAVRVTGQKQQAGF